MIREDVNEMSFKHRSVESKGVSLVVDYLNKEHSRQKEQKVQRTVYARTLRREVNLVGEKKSGIEERKEVREILEGSETI